MSACAQPAPTAAPASQPPPPASSSAAAHALPSDEPRGAQPPVGIRIPAIDIDSAVQHVGTEDRVLQIPPEPWVVGWWRDGARPGGDRGTVVLTAHLDSRKYGTGPFVRAKELPRGAAMVMVDTEGLKHRYRVERVDTFHKAALPYEELFRQSGPERVVLVTCGGTYDRNNGGWDSNVVVTFVPA
jgi:sortase (surface protein transpeptidase)